MLTRRTALAGLGGLPLLPRRSRAQAASRVAAGPIRIGILQDASGPYSYLGGSGSVACARQAAAEMAASHGVRVEFLQADHGNKTDNGIAFAKAWIDQGVDAFLEFNNSAIALGVNALIRDADRVMLANNVGSALLSGRDCTPNMTHWTFDTAMLARSIGSALFDTGGRSWFFIRADYAFGKALRDDTAATVLARGGQVMGEAAVPLGTTDFAAALLQAQSSGAAVVALALAGADLLNCLKQAAEFGLARQGQRVAALIIYLQDIHSLGLAAAQGTLLTESFYWDLNDRTRAFTSRVLPAMGSKPPNMGQAGAYSAVRHYLRAVASLDPAEARSGRAVVARMKAMPVEDDVLTNARVRPDGRVVSDAYLFEAKRPAESQGEWDLYAVKAKLGPDEAWRPMSQGGCKLAAI